MKIKAFLKTNYKFHKIILLNRRDNCADEKEILILGDT